MLRATKVYERYNENSREFEFVATCPFCDKTTKLIDGEIKQKCAHYVRHGHGCGGTTFLFEEMADNDQELEAAAAW